MGESERGERSAEEERGMDMDMDMGMRRSGREEGDG